MAPTHRPTAPAFRIPDLLSHCPFPAAYHPNGDAIAAASEHWVQTTCRVFTPAMRRHMSGLMSGQLAAYCYNRCSDARFRLICDFMLVLFLLDDLSDDLMTKETEVLADVVMNAMNFPAAYRPATQTKGKVQPQLESDASILTRDYWARIIPDAGPEVQARCIENVELYLIAVHEQARHRDSGEVPSTAEYVQLRRLSSGCKPLFDLLEYSLDMQLPARVIEDPLMRTLKDCVNDFVAFSNDIWSYNVEQSRGDLHNLVAIIMHNDNVDLQTAVDRAGDMCRAALAKYIETRERLVSSFSSSSPSFSHSSSHSSSPSSSPSPSHPSHGPELDAQLAAFLHGLESWMSGSLEWSFVTPRYFGSKRDEVKKTGWVKLLSRSRVMANAA